jgi:hypothetical protein
MQEEVMSPNEAWQAYRVLRSDRQIGYASEPNELPETWQAFTEGSLTSPNLWTDAYLVGTAMSQQVFVICQGQRN